MAPTIRGVPPRRVRRRPAASTTRRLSRDRRSRCGVGRGPVRVSLRVGDGNAAPDGPDRHHARGARPPTVATACNHGRVGAITRDPGGRERDCDVGRLLDQRLHVGHRDEPGALGPGARVLPRRRKSVDVEPNGSFEVTLPRFDSAEAATLNYGIAVCRPDGTGCTEAEKRRGSRTYTATVPIPGDHVIAFSTPQHRCPSYADPWLAAARRSYAIRAADDNYVEWVVDGDPCVR